MKPDATAIVHAIGSRAVSAREVVAEALAAAESDRFGCFWALDAEPALAGAAALDLALAHGERVGPLAGVPLAVKDCFALVGHPSWCGVRWRPDPPPAEVSAAAVVALAAGGAIPIGKTSMHQLAWGMSGEAPGFPVCRNPADSERMPGGSSGGSAAAVASGIVPLALGTDTGGSVRQPAAWCGIVGFKPSLGAVPLDGCAPLSQSLDTGGVLARSVRDCRLALTLLDAAFAVATAARAPRPGSGPFRIGIVEELFDGSEPGVAALCRAAIGNAGPLEKVSLPSPRRILGPLYAAELAEAWGARAGAQPDGILDDLRASIAAGRQVLAVDYLSAQRTLGALRTEATAAAAGIDVVACPTSPMVAPPLGGPDPTRRAGHNTRVFNALGWPSVSLPCGAIDGLPVGLMLSAPQGHDTVVLAAAERIARELGETV